MDMDNVCSGKIDIDAIEYHLKKTGSWDALSFNNKPYYNDIWGLSIEPYLLSCWHFQNNQMNSPNVVNKIERYVSEKLNNITRYELLECHSAFNGFAIYKKSKFIDCQYNWRIKTIRNYVTDEQIIKNESAIDSQFTINKSYHSIVHPATDCEHRQFHMEAIRKNNAKIRISPICLFS
jgi:hypothetical protein